MYFYIYRGSYKASETGNVIEISDSLVINIAEGLAIIEEISTESPLLRPGQITLALQGKKYLHSSEYYQKQVNR